MIVTIAPRRISRFLVSVIAALIVASVAGQILNFHLGYSHAKGFVPLFFVDNEANVPAWYSSVTLLLCAILLAAIGTAKRQEGARFAGHWSVLAAIFLLLSLDEAAGIHELPIEPLKSAGIGGGFLYFPWVILGMVFVLVVGSAYLKFLFHLPIATRVRFIVAATLYVGGAIGMEMLGGRYADAHGTTNFAFTMFVTGEELMEMLGVLVFIRALLDYLASHCPTIQLRIGDSP